MSRSLARRASWEGSAAASVTASWLGLVMLSPLQAPSARAHAEKKARGRRGGLTDSPFWGRHELRRAGTKGRQGGLRARPGGEAIQRRAFGDSAVVPRQGRREYR